MFPDEARPQVRTIQLATFRRVFYVNFHQPDGFREMFFNFIDKYLEGTRFPRKSRFKDISLISLRRSVFFAEH